LASGYPNAWASVDAWGQERVQYDFKKGTPCRPPPIFPTNTCQGEFLKKTGHFTQLVWKNTTSVGCGRTQCNGERDKDKDKDMAAPGWYVVCEYYPPGNVIGSFTAMVQEQVPEPEQPEGPSDPHVPEEEDERPCPQGGVCSAGERVRGQRMGALWVAVLVAWLLGSS
jgi:hypothetical protein